MPTRDRVKAALGTLREIKSLGSGSMVARLKLKELTEGAPPGVEPAA